MRDGAGRDLNIRSHDAGVVPTEVESNVAQPVTERLSSRGGFVTFSCIESTLGQAALQFPNVGVFVGQRHAPEHGPATNPTYS